MSTGFKEWTLICDALGNGTQSIILRKGGIAEGRAGFRFQHDDFLLFPTLFHEQAAKLKVPPNTALPEARGDQSLEIRYRVKVEWTRDLADLELVRQLAPFHLWRDEIIEERFYYDEKQSVSLAFIRAFRLSEPFVFEDSPRYGGCRSWVNLPELPLSASFEEVISEAAHRQRERELLAVLG
ncbi:MAG: hypothetical protein JWL90_3519 [Chthoniobacteraceae bacterium]|nr:hypothetical protein [Chthoniobacteraceae bacterium]